MRKVKCEKCGEEFPLNDTLEVRLSIVCRACAESIFNKEKVPANQVQQQVDPTICAGCGLDNGDSELPMLRQVPVCTACEKKFKSRPFPIWIKAALVGIVILVVSIMVLNSRFYYAYYDLRRFASAIDAGDIEQMAAYITSMSKHVPENEYLQTYAVFYEGILLLNQDKSAEALEIFEFCRGRVGMDEESGLDDLITNARIRVAFDQGNYDEFLELSLQLNEKFKEDYVYTAQVASAYACKYVETQDEQYKTKSLSALDSARALVNPYPEDEEYFAEYEQRILHRIHTQEIISRKEFEKRYPNGWIKDEQEAL